MFKYHIHIIYILFFTIAFLIACKPEEPEVILTISVPSINASAEENNYQVNVTTTADTYNVESDAAWCVLTFNNKIKNFSIKVLKNEELVTRITKLTITAATKIVFLDITQAAGLPPAYTSTKRDSLALLALNNGSIKWDKSSSMNTWEGVKVQTIDGFRRVIELNLPKSNILSGSISDSLSNLTALKYLDLSKNSLTGKIPSLNSMNQLLLIDLKNNELTGLIPLLPTSLVYISLGQNDLSGALPEQLKDLTQLAILDVGLNDFSGRIPSSWKILTKITYFYLYGNQLTNSIPSYISNFNTLEALALDYNMLTNEIPAGIGNISTLKKLSLQQNKLSGKIPIDLLNNINWVLWKDYVQPQQNSVILNVGTKKIIKIKSVHLLPDKYQFYNDLLK